MRIDSKRICRMLVKDGELLRLALATPKHEAIEEYEVQVRDIADESGSQSHTSIDDITFWQGSSSEASGRRGQAVSNQRIGGLF